MCGRLLRLWHTSYRYGVESPAGMKKMRRLTLMGIPWWYDVGDVHGLGALAKRAVVVRTPVDEA